jgi:cutinase
MGTSRVNQTRRIATVVAAALAAQHAFIAVPTAAADPCPDVEIVFARGTTEPPGPGGIGQAFVESLQSQLSGRAVAAYAVNYPASRDFDTSTPAGAHDASTHIQSTTASCPDTRLVLGGYSQGAGVIDLATASLPPQVADHVAATALFGAPHSAFADSLSPGPLPMRDALYASKTIDLCVPNDPICSDGWDMRAHTAYIETGMVNQAATFAASRI